jgi:glutamate-5-semialdehyde dehydrogenase
MKDEVDRGLAAECLAMARAAKAAAAELVTVSGGAKDAWLRHSAALLREQAGRILDANALDIEAGPGYGLTDAQVDRLRLTPARIESISVALEEIAMLRDPVGEVIEAAVRPNGLEVAKIRVPLGVVFFIYESRPNVTADAAAICVKSGNAVILRGGKEASHSNRAIVDLLTQAARKHGIPNGAIQLVGTTDRAAVGHFLALPDLIDVAIPRGGEGLIRRVASEAKMPVMKHFAGNCHVYVDRAADPELAVRLTVNSKCQRMGVCNACESLLVHRDVVDTLLPRLARALREQGIEIRGDASACSLVEGSKPATEEDYFAEYLGPVISVRVVDSLDDAIRHINHYGSHHTDAIITTDLNAARQFTKRVDSSAVMVNASTRFNDGGEFGLGAEIGISTDRFHARGPCGLRELTSYKYVVHGDGQIRT